jgi:enoyl-CoA hydratase
MNEASPEAAVLTEVRANILLITLNRPASRNAVNSALASGIAGALDELDANGGLAAGVLAGAGRGFCSGMDLRAFVAGEPVSVPGRGFAGIVETPSEKPLIAAVEGFAVAGGLEIALACDVIVASREARFGIPEVKRALIASGGALRRLPERIPAGVAMDLALTGDLIDGERAHSVGLVDRLTDAGGAVDAALELARAIAANGPLALRATKRLLRAQSDWDEATFWRNQAEIAGPVMASEDAREGAVAFAEKRAPQWNGR